MASVINLPAPAPTAAGEVLARTLEQSMKAQRQKEMARKAGIVAQGIQNAKDLDSAFNVVLGAAQSGVFEDPDDFNSALNMVSQIHGKANSETFTAYDNQGNEVKLRVPQGAQITTDEQLRKITGNPDVTLSKKELVEFFDVKGTPLGRQPASAQVPNSYTKSQLDALNMVQDNVRADEEAKRSQRRLELQEEEAKRQATAHSRSLDNDPEWMAQAKDQVVSRKLPLTQANINKASNVEKQTSIARDVLFRLAGGRIDQGIFIFDDRNKEKAYTDAVAIVRESLWSGEAKDGENAAVAAWKKVAGDAEVKPAKVDTGTEPKALDEGGGVLKRAGKKVAETFSGKPKAEEAKPSADLKGSKWVDKDGINYDYEMIENTAKKHKVPVEAVIKQLGLKRAGNK